MDSFNILELETGSHIHFVGIGGISMSALAEILNNMGFKVSGSDMKSSGITEKLAEKGIKIYIGHDAANISSANVVVYTAAVKGDNPEIVKAKELNLPVVERATLLGEIMRKFKYSIGVSGTHGKTTTTSMVSLILMEAHLDPTITVGGELDSIGGNLRVGKSEYFVTEACEYVESFLKFHPFIGIILNIDADHLDYFKDIDAITDAFVKYAKLIPQNGYLIANNDDERMNNVINNVNCNIVTYSINNPSTYMADNISFNSKGCAQFDVIFNKKSLGRVTLNVPGLHNVYNALASIACASCVSVNFETCKSALLGFSGAKRRFEYKGSIKDFTVIDDYAHHPAEVKATLTAAVNYPHNKIWCIFQPHTYTRTKCLLEEFSEAFGSADKIIIADIYAAREKDTGEIHSKNLVQRLTEKGNDALYIHDFDSICSYILDNAQKDDLIITMGAGDIHKVGEQLVANNSKKICV